MKKIMKFIWGLIVISFIVIFPIYLAILKDNFNFLWLWIPTIIVGAYVHDMLEETIDEL